MYAAFMDYWATKKVSSISYLMWTLMAKKKKKFNTKDNYKNFTFTYSITRQYIYNKMKELPFSV